MLQPDPAAETGEALARGLAANRCERQPAVVAQRQPGAAAKAEKLRKIVAETKIMASEGTPIKLTVSIGIGVKKFPGGENITKDDIIREADKQLYLAKEKGRNRVCYASYEKAS